MESYDELIKYRHELDLFVQSCGSVYIWGTGNGLDNVVRVMRDIGCEIKGLLCSQGYKSFEYIDDIKVYQYPGDIVLSDTDGIVMASMEMYWNEITDCLRSNGYKGQIFYNLAKRRNHLFVDRSVYVPNYLNETAEGTFFQNMGVLKTIGERTHARKSCEMLSKYEFVFNRYRNEYMNVLELGVDLGGSVKMLKEYFINATVTGVDIDEKCKKYEEERLNIYVMNVGDVKELAKLRNLKPKIIIDDASHLWSHQIKALLVLWESLSSGGIYIVEDIHTSFRAIRDWGYGDASLSTYEFLLAIEKIVASGELLDISRELYPIGKLVGEIERIGSQVDMMCFIRESCILIKK